MRRLGSGQEHETTTKPLPESFQKVLKATALLFNTEMPEEVVRVWKDLLNYCSENEAIAGLKKWQYQGAYFPKPAEILQLIADARQQAQINSDGCSHECKARHGKGYHGNDMIIIFKKFLAARESNPNCKPLDFLDELDKQRGRAPLWRQDDVRATQGV